MLNRHTQALHQEATHHNLVLAVEEVGRESDGPIIRTTKDIYSAKQPLPGV